MKFLVSTFTCAGLLAAFPLANAEPVQSTTSVFVSLRECVAGETPCDSIGRARFREIGGTPGGSDAEAAVQEPEFGDVESAASLGGEPGSATLRTRSISLPAVRNAGTAFVIQRIANSSEATQSLTFDATVVYDQEVPEENATFPDEGGARSGVFMEMELFSLAEEFIEAGVTSEENWAIMDSGPPSGYESLGSVNTNGIISTVTAQGSEKLSLSVELEPGGSVWMFALLQSIAANGAVVEAELVTRLAIDPD